MRDLHGTVLYVGKAKDLKKRLSSYLRFKGSNASKTGVMITKITLVETIVTGTEKEAFILEASLIKKYLPRYNILLRDDKNYPLIKVTVNEEWPRLMMTRRRSKDGARYFGPYSSSASMWETIHYLNKLFPLRRCKGKNLQKRTRPCLNFQMHKCTAPCLGQISKADYLRNVDNILCVLAGKNKKLLKILHSEMLAAATDLDFELAAQLRDKINSLKKTMEKQIIVATHKRDQDLFSLLIKDGAAALSILHIRQGVINGHNSFYLGTPIGSDAENMAEIVRRFYVDEQAIPQDIILSVMPDENDSIANWLSEKKGSQVNLKVPIRGDARKLIVMATNNASRVFDEYDKKNNFWLQLAADLQKKLTLHDLPERVICCDISNIGGKQSVGAVVSFFCGEKESSKYRHYKIKTVEGPDDYASMREVLTRHLNRAQEGDFLPNLLVVDGGKGQLSMAISVVNALHLQERISLVGIAKEKNSEGEKLYRPGRKNPIIPQAHSKMLLFLMRVRDESHRFGITFHRKWRQKETLTSELETIPGLGPVRRAALLKEIGSVSRIKSASVPELTKVSGISLTLAQEIVAFFSPK